MRIITDGGQDKGKGARVVLRWTIYPVLCLTPRTYPVSLPSIQESQATSACSIITNFDCFKQCSIESFHTFHPPIFPFQLLVTGRNTYIPAPFLICLTTPLSSTTRPLALSNCSRASTTRSKLDFAPLSCVKRAIARFARRPRWRRVWNSAAMEREGMRRAISTLASHNQVSVVKTWQDGTEGN